MRFCVRLPPPSGPEKEARPSGWRRLDEEGEDREEDGEELIEPTRTYWRGRCGPGESVVPSRTRFPWVLNRKPASGPAALFPDLLTALETEPGVGRKPRVTVGVAPLRRAGGLTPARFVPPQGEYRPDNRYNQY